MEIKYIFLVLDINMILKKQKQTKRITTQSAKNPFLLTTFRLYVHILYITNDSYLRLITTIFDVNYYTNAKCGQKGLFRECTKSLKYKTVLGTSSLSLLLCLLCFPLYFLSCLLHLSICCKSEPPC